MGDERDEDDDDYKRRKVVERGEQIAILTLGLLQLAKVVVVMFGIFAIFMWPLPRIATAIAGQDTNFVFDFGFTFSMSVSIVAGGAVFELWRRNKALRRRVRELERSKPSAIQGMLPVTDGTS